MEIRESIARLVERRDLTAEEAEAVMGQIMRGEATPAQIGGFLVALRMKGETVEEITGVARAMRSHAVLVRTSRVSLADTCGTGGDRSGTFNISTVTAFVVAGAGFPVAKHGNRSVSSHCGSADVLEALGIHLDLGPEEVARCIDESGVGFLFAPPFSPRDEACYRPPTGDEHPDGFQHSGTAHQPGGRPSSGPGHLRCQPHRNDREGFEFPGMSGRLRGSRDGWAG